MTKTDVRKTKEFTLGRAQVPVTVYADADALGQALGAEVLAMVEKAGAQGRKFLLGCPGGRSLRTTYHAMGMLAKQQEADLSHLVIVMMDDYLVEGPRGLEHCPADAHYSCRLFARKEIQAVLNQHLPRERQVRDENVWLPDVSDPPEYDRRLTAAGGVDLFLIASGASDGHVAFNPPGSERDSITRIIPLPESTRRDNLATFPEFGTLDEVPAHGVSSGLSTIADLSRRVWLVMHGRGKRQSLRMLADGGDFRADWPVSIIFQSQSPRIILDEEVAAELEDR